MSKTEGVKRMAMATATTVNDTDNENHEDKLVCSEANKILDAEK